MAALQMIYDAPLWSPLTRRWSNTPHPLPLLFFSLIFIEILEAKDKVEPTTPIK